MNAPRFNFARHLAGQKMLENASSIRIEMCRSICGELSVNYTIEGSTIEVEEDADGETVLVRKPGAEQLAADLLAAFAAGGGQ